MKKYLKVQATCMLVCLSNSAFAKDVLIDSSQAVDPPDAASDARSPATVRHVTARVEIPPEISDKSRNKYYEFSLDGLQDYLNDLGKDDPKTSGVLQPQLDLMKSKDKTAQWVRWSFIGAGVAWAAIFIATAPTSSPSLSDPNYMTSADSHMRAQWIGIGGGVVLVSAGILAPLIFGPSKRDIRNFVNNNNELTPKHQLELKNFGFNLDPQSGAPSLAFNFSF